MRLDGLILFGPGFAILPGVQGYKEECVVRSPDVAEQTETDDAGGVLHSWRLGENLLHLFRSFACPLHGRRIWELHIDMEVALVFIRQEAGRQVFSEEPRCQSGEYEQHHYDTGLANQVTRPADKAVGRALPICVEPAKEFSQRSAGLLLVFQQ